jgi:hypothetical protein
MAHPVGDTFHDLELDRSLCQCLGRGPTDPSPADDQHRARGTLGFLVWRDHGSVIGGERLLRPGQQENRGLLYAEMRHHHM